MKIQHKVYIVRMAHGALIAGFECKTDAHKYGAEISADNVIAIPFHPANRLEPCPVEYCSCHRNELEAQALEREMQEIA